MPKISVIIPVYNTEKYLAECLDSVLGQTFQDIEVLCVNDGSTDNAAAVLAEYAAKDNRIKVLTQENQGLSAARNTALEVAEGEWITFLDSDDALPPNTLMLLYTIAQKSGCKIVASRNRLSMTQYKAGAVSSMAPLNYHTWHGLKDFVEDNKIFSSACSKLFAAALFKTQRFTKGMLFEDWPVMTILFGQVEEYATTDIPCYVYREDNQSITRSSFSVKKVQSYIQGVRMVYENFKDSDKLNIARKRMAVAIKMLVNKVYRAKDKDLNALLLQEMQALFDEHIISKQDLVLKTRWRLWRLKHK